jgi:DUF1365 family protein
VRSNLYTGQIRHRRTGGRAYQFQYGVFYLYIDLDEISEVDRRLRILSYNRFNVLSLLDRDHTGKAGAGVRDAVYQRLTAHGIDLEGCSVALLTNARILNYVFNPVSFYFVRDKDRALRHVLAEVHNTHGQRHVYDLDRIAADDNVYRAEATKAFYVSPFIDMEGRYEFSCTERGGALDLRLDEFSPDGDLFFEAQIVARPRPLTDANLARALLQFPFVTAKTTALIHWHGLKLWLRGERFRPNPRKGEVIR